MTDFPAPNPEDPREESLTPPAVPTPPKKLGIGFADLVIAAFFFVMIAIFLAPAISNRPTPGATMSAKQQQIDRERQIEAALRLASDADAGR